MEVATGQLRTALTQIERKMTDTAAKLKSVSETVAEESFSTEEGVSLLEFMFQLRQNVSQVKNHLLLEYNAAVCVVCLLKLEGESLHDHPVIDHLGYLRTALEKLKPIETKIKYQIDKLLRNASAKPISEGKADPLSFKPNVSNLQPKAVEDGKADFGDASRGNDGAYKAPKLTAVPFEDDNSKEAKRMRRQAKEQLKLANSEMMKDLRSEYSSMPEEVSHNDFGSSEVAAEIKERERLEESHFTRLGGRKKLRKKQDRARGTLIGVSGFDVTKGLHGLEQSSSDNLTMREKMAEVRKKRQRRD